MKFIPVAIGIFLSTQSSSSASTHLRQTNSRVESSDAAEKSRNYLRSLQGLDMSMSMPSMTASIESTSESGSDDTWVAEVINNLESKSGITIPQSVAMDIVKSNELPAHHHSGQMKCRWFLPLLFKYKYYYFVGLSEDHLNHIIDYVCGVETSNPSATPTSKSTPSPTPNPTRLPTTPSPTPNPTWDPTSRPTACTGRKWYFKDSTTCTNDDGWDSSSGTIYDSLASCCESELDECVYDDVCVTASPSHGPSLSPSHKPTESPISCNEVVKEDYFILPSADEANWDAPVVFNFTGLPPVVGNVQLTVGVRGDLGNDAEYFNVTVQDDYLGTVGNEEGDFSPTDERNDCNLIPKEATFNISEANFNDGLDANNSTLTVTLTPSGLSETIGLSCDYNDADVTLTYTSCA